MGQLLYWDPEGYVKEGSGNGASLFQLIWAPFLRILRRGAIWSFYEGPGLPRLGSRVWDTKGLFLRPRWFGTERAQTQLLLHTHLHLHVAVGKRTNE